MDDKTCTCWWQGAWNPSCPVHLPSKFEPRLPRAKTDEEKLHEDIEEFLLAQIRVPRP